MIENNKLTISTKSIIVMVGKSLGVGLLRLTASVAGIVLVLSLMVKYPTFTDMLITVLIALILGMAVFLLPYLIIFHAIIPWYHDTIAWNTLKMIVDSYFNDNISIKSIKNKCGIYVGDNYVHYYNNVNYDTVIRYSKNDDGTIQVLILDNVLLEKLLEDKEV